MSKAPAHHKQANTGCLYPHADRYHPLAAQAVTERAGEELAHAPHAGVDGSGEPALRLQAFDYIPKPITQEKLMAVTARALKRRMLTEQQEKYRTNIINVYRSMKNAIIVVDNNSTDKTAALAGRSGAIVVFEARQGYGFALRRGMSVYTDWPRARQ